MRRRRNVEFWLFVVAVVFENVAAVGAVQFYCPPLLGKYVDTADCWSSQRRQAYRHYLGAATVALRSLWLASTRQMNPRRQLAYMRAFETMKQLECLWTFSGCFPGGDVHNGVEFLAGREMCELLDKELVEVFQTDAEIHAHVSYKLFRVPFISSFSELSGHPCNTVYAGQILEYFHLEDHKTLRAQAVGPYLHWVDDGFVHARHGKEMSHFIPAWGAPETHSFNSECGRKDLPWWYTHQNLTSMFDSLRSPQNGWVVNIGAGDGECPFRTGAVEELDPTNCLFRQGHGGVAFEGDDARFPELRELFGGRADVDLHLGYVGPADVARAVGAYAAKVSSDAPLLLVKIDVDNCDCCYLESIMTSAGNQSIRPWFVHVEVHSLIPPPFSFRPLEPDSTVQDSLRDVLDTMGKRGHMVHCSLSAFEEMLRPFGYELLHLVSHDAVFVLSTVRAMLRQVSSPRSVRQEPRSVYDIWTGGLICHPLRVANALDVAYREVFMYDYRRWADPNVSVEDRLQTMRRYLDYWSVPRDSYRLHIWDA